jgi:hypothetical protein
MKLPSFNDKYVTALRSSFLRFPEKKIPIHIHGRDSFVAMEKNPTIRRASVFVPLCNRHGVPSVLFTVRTKTVSTHKGHVSFPGGHQEAGESAEAAAVRELREELYMHGLDSTRSGSGSGSGSTYGQVKGSTAVPNVTIIGECQRIPALTVSECLCALQC